MSEQVGPYHVVDLTPRRRVVLSMLDLAGSKHSMCGLLEIESGDGLDEEQAVH